MTSTHAIAEIKNLIDSASKAGTDSELVEVGLRLGADVLYQVLDILGGPLGMQVYVPSPANFTAAIRRALRDHAICAGYDGKPQTIAAFAIEFGITKTRVRQILASQRGREI